MTFLLRTIFAIIFSLLFLALSCKGSGESPGPFRELSFTVDSTKIGASTTAGDITLRVPAGWDAAGEQILSGLREAAKADTSSFAVQPEGAFVHGQTGSVLISTTFRRADLKIGFAAWARKFVENYRSSHEKLTIEEEWLTIGGVKAVQLYSSDSLRVQFKFIVDAPVPVGLDFSTPRAAWSEVGKSVESSLGTLRKK